MLDFGRLTDFEHQVSCIQRQAATGIATAPDPQFPAAAVEIRFPL
jgi:hypothetical protein